MGGVMVGKVVGGKGGVWVRVGAKVKVTTRGEGEGEGAGESESEGYSTG